MKNKIYYGEYSLKHWIDLILKKNIVLPEYQRSYVWGENALLGFIKSLKEKQFIPPVTIAHYKVEDENAETNLILDGQQRLTSLLLAAIGWFPDQAKFEDIEEVIKNENDSEDDDASYSEYVNNSGNNKSIKWTFNQLLELGSDIPSIKDKVEGHKKYYQLKALSGMDDKFLEETFIGFSYIVPASEKKDEVQKLFSKTFREINFSGKSLTAQESRRSLYFMNDKYKDFFDGKINNEDVLGQLHISENLQPKKIDFIRYLSILSQYNIKKSSYSVMKYYSSYASRETFYVDFVSYILGLEQENYKDKFDGFYMEETFPNDSWKERFKSLKEATSEIKLKSNDGKYSKVFDSWIDADYYLFGLIYYILFENTKIKFDDSLFKELNDAIQEKRKDKNTSYSKSPNRISFVRERLEKSIAIYSKHIG